MFLSFILISSLSSASSQISFVEQPQDGQFYCRDLITNEAVVPVSGSIATPDVDELALVVFKDGVYYQSDIESLIYTNGQASFDLTVTIVAGLHNYNFYLYAQKSGIRRQIMSARHIVCGDAFIIDGQSNAVATYYHQEGLANESQSNWIRSYGTASVNASDVPVDAEWHVADGIGAYSSGCVGAWALRCANRLMDYLQMPIAVINGAVGGTIIASHLRDNLDPENLNTIYGRLLYRANKSGLASKARAIIWHQGESDGQGDPAIYLADWNIMRSAWAEDYPEANNVFIFQIRNGCGVSGDLDIRDLQRRLPDLYDDITAIPTTGIDEHDGCHFFYQGYKTMGTWAAAAIARVLYDAPFPSSGYPPRVASATFSSSTHDSVDLIFRDQSQTLFLDQNIEGRFYLVGGGAETVSSATATLGKITLQLSGPTLATHISFLGNIGAGPWIKNQFGVGAFTFKLPILP